MRVQGYGPQEQEIVAKNYQHEMSLPCVKCNVSTCAVMFGWTLGLFGYFVFFRFAGGSGRCRVAAVKRTSGRTLVDCGMCCDGVSLLEVW